MDFDQLIGSLTPAMHAALKRAIEIGKWPDGRVLSPEQKALCMEAVINYDQRFVGESDRVGYIDRGSKMQGETCSGEPSDAADSPSPLKWS